jgi:hypothetical protein
MVAGHTCEIAELLFCAITTLERILIDDLRLSSVADRWPGIVWGRWPLLRDRGRSLRCDH